MSADNKLPSDTFEGYDYEDDTPDSDPLCLGCGADTEVDFEGYCSDCDEEDEDY